MGKRDGLVNGRKFVEDIGDSGNLEERLHEQIMAGGGYYREKFVDAENIPGPDDYNPEINMMNREEMRAKIHREQREERMFWQIVHGISCSGKRKDIETKDEFPVCSRWSKEKRLEFIKNIPLLPV